MKIQTRLKVAAGVPLVMALTAFLALGISHRVIRHDQWQSLRIMGVIQSLGDLNGLAGACLLRHDESSRRQFLAEYESAMMRIASVSVRKAGQQRLLDAIRENTGAAKELLPGIVDVQERMPSGADADILRRGNDQTADRLLIHLRQGVADAVRLEMLVRAGIDAKQMAVHVLVFILILAVTLPLTLVLLRMTGIIGRDFATLNRGTDAVDSGDLSHRIGLTGGDELAGLAQSFDQMTGRLQTITVRKNDLEREVAERKRVEKERDRLLADVQAGERRTQQALGVSRSFTFDWDPATDRVLRSASCGAILGLSGDEVCNDIGANYFRRVHSSDRARFTQVLAGLTPAAASYTVEYRVMRGDGSVAVLEEAGLGLFNAGGDLTRLIGVSTDITVRKQAENALREVREDLDRAQAVAHVGSWRLDVRKNEFYWSDENRRIFGFSMAVPMTYETFLDSVHPDDREYVHGKWLAALRGEPYDIEHRIVVFGAVKWVRERAELEFDANGELLGGFGTTQDVTDLKGAQQALRDAHARAEWLARFPEENPNPVLRAATDGRMLYANAAAVSAGWTCDDGRTLAGPLRPLIESVIAAREPVMEDVALDGLIFSVSVALFPGEGYVNMYGRDVSEMNALQRREKEDAVQLAWGQSAIDTINAMHEGVALLEQDGTIISVNPAVECLTGIDGGAIVGRNVRHVLPGILSGILAGGRRAPVIRGLTALRRGETPKLPVLLLRRADGSESHVQVSMSWMRTPEHSRMIAVVTLIDVTEQRETARRLEESERKYRELVENANSIIMRVAPDCTITFFNEYAQEFFGYAEDEVLGRNVVGTIIPAADTEGRAPRAWTGAIELDQEPHGGSEHESMRKDGRRVWVHWSNRSVRDDQGVVLEVLCVGTDITRRRELETEARIHHERLHALAERLASSEEQNRWRITRYIHDAIVQNLSLACIRLGTMEAPLASAALADEKTKLSQVRALLDDAIAECRQVMSDLTPALLYEMGLVPALNDIVLELAAKHGVRMTVECSGQEMSDLPHSLRGLLFDASRELIMNALKHAGPCEIRVTVNFQDALLTIAVADSGAGFDVASGEAPRGHHGGFGLFSIRQRLEGLGGCLEIDSAPGRGTMAMISVPLE